MSTPADVRLADKKHALLMQLLRKDGFDVAECSTIPRRSAAASIPLSFGQQRLWFLDQLAPGTPFYNSPAIVPLDFAVDAAVLERCLNEIVRRHEALRTTFRQGPGAPEQVVAPSLHVRLDRHDLANWPVADRETEALRRINLDVSAPFDLATGPLIRTTLFSLNPSKHVLSVTAHHIVFDGWSMRAFFDELSALYPAFLSNRPSPLPELPVQYADYAVWQRQWLQGTALQRHLQYWERQLDRLPVLDLPTDHPRPSVASFRGGAVGFDLPPSLVARLRERARAEDVTLFMLLLGAFVVLLHRYAGQNDIVIGSPLAGRTRSQLERLIGFFVNTVVLRIQTAGEPTFRELLRRVKDVTLGAFAHQDLPFEMLVEHLQPTRDLGRNPLFQVSFQLFSGAAVDAGMSSSPPPEVRRSTSVFDLSANLWEHGQSISGQFEYSSDLFDQATIERMRGHFQTLLEAVADNATLRLWQLPLLTSDERHQLLVEWNDTHRPYTRDACLHTLFDRQVERTPDAVAVASHHGSMTYAALQNSANRLAHYLIARGAGPDVPIGLCIRRSPDLLVGLLAILKTGSAYVPLDPSHPSARQVAVLEDCRAPLVVTEEALETQFLSSSATVICLDRECAAIVLEPDDTPASTVNAEHLAYVIYTSGSTGAPKGILVPHRGLVNYLQWCTRAYEVETGCGAPVHSSIAFDLTITALMAPLLAGRTVYLIPEDEGAEALGSSLRQHTDFSLVKITPAHLGLLAKQVAPEDAPGRTRRFIVGGEDLRAEHVAFWHTSAPQTAIVNEYGPSETVVGCCTYEIPAGSSLPLRIPIGRPIDNTELFVLDEHREPVPIGVPGELYIGGDGLARGYLGRPTLTDAAFVPHPFSVEPGARLYRTGDRVRYLADGNLVYLGRFDDQIKLRGFRIEPGEIEHCLQALPGVVDAVVVLREDSPGDRRLVAYLVGSDIRPAADLRNAVAAVLPVYMVPSAFVVLDALPLTPNGKVDRRALPLPDRRAMPSRGSGGIPTTMTEQRMASVWREVLHIEQLGVHEDFFADLGGHSLLAVQLASRIRSEFKTELSLRQLFEQPTVAALSTLIDATGEAPPPISTPPLVRRSAAEVDVDGLTDEEVEHLLAELMMGESR